MKMSTSMWDAHKWRTRRLQNPDFSEEFDENIARDQAASDWLINTWLHPALSGPPPLLAWLTVNIHT